MAISLRPMTWLCIIFAIFFLLSPFYLKLFYVFYPELQHNRSFSEMDVLYEKIKHRQEAVRLKYYPGRANHVL